MLRSGVSILKKFYHPYGDTIELEHKERREYIIPGSVALLLNHKPLHYTQVDAHGNPQISGVAAEILSWQINQMIRSGEISDVSNIRVEYYYEATSERIEIPIVQRLPMPWICPVCGKPITISELDEQTPIADEIEPDLIEMRHEWRVAKVGRERAVVHKACADKYQQLKMIDELACIIEETFSNHRLDKEDRFTWGRGPRSMYCELIKNEYCQECCCINKPWMLFHTPIGDIKVGWRHSTINVTFMENFVNFDMSIFDGESITRYTHGNKRTIHAFGVDEMLKYLRLVYQSILSSRETYV